MKAILATLVILTAGVLAHAEGEPIWISPSELARQAAGVPVTGPETPEELNERSYRDAHPVINPAELNRQGANVPVTGPAAIRQYPGCYTTYQAFEKAQRACPPGVVAAKVWGFRGFKGYTCQCAIDTDRGGNNN